MSVTFSIKGQRIDYDSDEGWMNMNEVNAAELLQLLGLYEEGKIGEIRARELRARIAQVGTVEDKGRFPSIESRPGRATAHVGGRRPNYANEKLAELDRIAEMAGDLGTVRWG